jgi:hypothetical protein
MGMSKKELVHKGSGYRLYWYSDEGYVESSTDRDLSTDEFRENMERLLALFQEKKARKCLADMSKLGVISPENLAWSETDWWPRCRKTQMKIFAMVLPKSLAAHMAFDKATKKWDTDAWGQVRAFFANVERAREWLLKQ